MRQILAYYLLTVLFAGCGSKNKALNQQKIHLSYSYTVSDCFREVFQKVKHDIEKNTYTRIDDCPFCKEGLYSFSEKDLKSLDVNPNPKTIRMLTDFYLFTNVEPKVIFTVQRDDRSILLFGGHPIGASGKYSDYLDWIIVDKKTGEILVDSQKSLSKLPFVFYFDSESQLRLIKYDYDRANEGYMKVRSGDAPVSIETFPYILQNNRFVATGNNLDTIYCEDQSFYGDF